MSLLEKIKFELTCIGYTKKHNWECIKFNCKINDQDFDYHVGMGHVKTSNDYNIFFSPKKAKNEGYTISTSWSPSKLSEHHHHGLIQAMVKPPKLEEILYCLFLDSEAHDESFENWCDNLGYNTDSIKAKKSYETCVETYFKLRKALGTDFAAIKEEIQTMGL